MYSADGLLQRITEVSQVSLLQAGEIPMNPRTKPIWEEFAHVLDQVPPEELAKLPSDGADKHDFYIYGTTQELP